MRWEYKKNMKVSICFIRLFNSAVIAKFSEARSATYEQTCKCLIRREQLHTGKLQNIKRIDKGGPHMASECSLTYGRHPSPISLWQASQQDAHKSWLPSKLVEACEHGQSPHWQLCMCGTRVIVACKQSLNLVLAAWRGVNTRAHTHTHYSCRHWIFSRP